MPAKNVIKVYVPDSYYHVYNRGVSKQEVFIDSQDYEVFLSLFKRYLGDPQRNSNRVTYPSLRDEVCLVAYCLMPNHFHLLVYQITEDGMTDLLKRVSVSYGMYFNKKYKHAGVIFQQRYRAVRIISDSQLDHIGRYIHMNPKDYTSWQWSSLRYYTGEKSARWIDPLEDIGGDYMEFLDDYKGRRDELDELKDELAG